MVYTTNFLKPRARGYKTFYERNLGMFEISKLVFVYGKPLQPNLMFVAKGKSLPKSIAPERGFTLVGFSLFANIRLSWKGLPGTNNLAYFEN